MGWQNRKHWPVVHLDDGAGRARCGRRPPASLIAWVGVTCAECVAEWSCRCGCHATVQPGLIRCPECDDQ